MSPKLSSVDKTNKNWLPQQRVLGVRKTNFRFIIYSHGFTNPANSAKIDGVDFEIIGLKGIVKMLKKIRNSSRTGSPPVLLSRVG